MSWADSINALFDSMVAATGGDNGANGSRVFPTMTGFTPIGMLATMSPSVVDAVTRVNQTGAVIPAIALTTGTATGDDTEGAAIDPLLGTAPTLNATADGTNGITVAQYVSGTGISANMSWQRYITTPAALFEFTVSNGTIAGTNDNSGLVNPTRQLLIDWDACIASATNIMNVYGGGGGPPTNCDPVAAAAFCNLLYTLGADLDALNEAPLDPATIYGALQSAGTASAAALTAIAAKGGAAAADVANAIGDVAGSALSGFLSGAGPLVLLVGAVVVFAVVR